MATNYEKKELELRKQKFEANPSPANQMWYESQKIFVEGKASETEAGQGGQVVLKYLFVAMLLVAILAIFARA